MNVRNAYVWVFFSTAAALLLIPFAESAGYEDLAVAETLAGISAVGALVFFVMAAFKKEE